MEWRRSCRVGVLCSDQGRLCYRQRSENWRRTSAGV